VGLLLNNYNDVSGLNSRVLIGLAMEYVLLVVRCTLVDLSFDDLFLLYNFLAIAAFAFVLFINNFAFTTAIITRSRRLSVHAWPKHLHSGYHATTLAGSALLDSAFFTTFTFALAANSLAIDCDFGLFSTVNFFESDFERMLDGLHFFGALLLSSATHAKHLTENVIHASVTAATFLETFLAILIVDVPLFLIREHLVCILEFLEFLFVATAVRVIFEGRLSEGFLYIVHTGILLDSQQLVELRVTDLLRGTTSAAHLFKSASKGEAATAAEKHFDFNICVISTRN
jgi:hypothetical protein